MKESYGYLLILTSNTLCSMILFSCHATQPKSLSTSLSQHASQRYSILAPLLNQYSRPITLLNIGATDKWFIVTLAKNYDISMVIVSRDPHKDLETLCSETELTQLILLKKELSLAEFERLSECEHFDVTLIVDNFNALPLLRKAAIAHAVNLGDYTIIEVPQGLKRQGTWTRAHEIRSYILESNATIIHETFIEDAYLCISHKPKTTLKRAYWGKPELAQEDDYAITSTFTHKYLYKKATDTVSLWHPGINLHTFKALSGVYPSYRYLQDYIQHFYTLEHNDFNPCNFIIQGKTLLPIDFNDPRRKVDHKIGFDRLLKLFCA